MGGLMFPKEGKRKKRKKHAKSILQPKEEKWCYLCAALYGDYGEKYVQEHHVCFGKNRAVSEELGLKVNLCAAHHTQGPEAVHRNREMAEKLCKKAQEIFEQTHSHEEWMGRIGRDYL